nr:vegetative cell wall protein gp1-like [Aegilops tauschii subsp. strangulata]
MDRGRPRRPSPRRPRRHLADTARRHPAIVGARLINPPPRVDPVGSPDAPLLAARLRRISSFTSPSSPSSSPKAPPSLVGPRLSNAARAHALLCARARATRAYQLQPRRPSPPAAYTRRRLCPAAPGHVRARVAVVVRGLIPLPLRLPSAAAALSANRATLLRPSEPGRAPAPSPAAPRRLVGLALVARSTRRPPRRHLADTARRHPAIVGARLLNPPPRVDPVGSADGPDAPLLAARLRRTSSFTSPSSPSSSPKAPPSLADPRLSNAGEATASLSSPPPLCCMSPCPHPVRPCSTQRAPTRSCAPPARATRAYQPQPRCPSPLLPTPAAVSAPRYLATSARVTVVVRGVIPLSLRLPSAAAALSANRATLLHSSEPGRAPAPSPAAPRRLVGLALVARSTRRP